MLSLSLSLLHNIYFSCSSQRWATTGGRPTRAGEETRKVKFTLPSIAQTLVMITTMMATLKSLWRPGSSNSNHSSAHSHFLSPHISPVNSPAIRWSLPSIVFFCHCPHSCHHNCLIRASQRVPEENLALVAQPQVSNAIAAQLKSKNFLFNWSLVRFH